MSKTPYEIRLELLSMAQGILMEQCMNERIRLENDWNMKCEIVRLRGGTDYPPFPGVPVVNSENVIAMAEKLNGFVSNNGEHKNV
jgi:hypothetical protein